MAKYIDSDASWRIFKPMAPKHPPSSNGDMPNKRDRLRLTDALFVLKTGVACGAALTKWDIAI